MKPTTQTPERLVIEDKPWFLWLLLYGMGSGAILSVLFGQTAGLTQTLLVLALGVGTVWIAWRFEPYQRIIFDRAANTFTHSIQRLGKSPQVWERPLAEIENAFMESLDGNTRVTLRTPKGPHPLESGFTGFDRRALTNAINEWLDQEP